MYRYDRLSTGYLDDEYCRWSHHHVRGDDPTEHIRRGILPPHAEAQAALHPQSSSEGCKDLDCSLLIYIARFTGDSDEEILSLIDTIGDIGCMRRAKVDE